MESNILQNSSFIKNIFVVGFVLFMISCGPEIKVEKVSMYTTYVNPFLGTAPLTNSKEIGYEPPKNWRVWAGFTFPGSSLPNAMVQLSPITDYTSGAGYKYEDDTIFAFTHTNKGHWNLCNIPIIPISGELKNFGSHFSHEKEEAEPGFYSVFLEDYDIQVNLTSSLRCGFHQYIYKNRDDRKIVFDLSKSNKSFRNLNRVTNWGIERIGNKALKGFQEVENDKVYFYAILNEKIEKLQINQEGSEKGVAVLYLKAGDGPVELKIGLSYVSEQNAKENLEEEIINKSFNEVHKEATSNWESLLSKIEVEGSTKKQKELFYSSLYRSFLWPALRSDINGEFRDVMGKVKKENFRYYTIPSLWDTYRNKLVLMTIISPEITSDVIKSLLDRGENTGFIPTFFHGDHAAPFIAGAYLRGIDDFDIKKAYHLLLNNATQEGGPRPFISEYIDNGYISTPQIQSPHLRTNAKAGVSKTLEYAYDDYSISLLAKRLGDTDNFNKYKKRSGNYKNVFDPTSHLMRGKLKNGNWVEDFNPQSPYNKYMYREANSWQVSFYVPHDMEGLIQLHGGNENFENKLDSMFTLPWNPKYKAANVTSFIGQYSHGNQPDHETPFDYYFIGKPEKSQKIIDTILNSLYGLGKSKLALPGMDDAGEMSAWYVLNSIGLYPFSPADPDYIVSVPVFSEVKWKLSNGKELIIVREGKGRNLKKIKVNGQDLQGYFVPHQLFKDGGSIKILTNSSN
jgi:predicted alpha-1,2-mannosidase